MAEDEATHSIDASMRTFLGDLELPGLQPGMQDEEIASIMFEHARESKDYFVGSRKWKNLLDMVLREYRHCMIVSFQKERSEVSLFSLTPESDSNDLLFFPDDIPDLLLLTRWYVIKKLCTLPR